MAIIHTTAKRKKIITLGTLLGSAIVLGSITYFMLKDPSTSEASAPPQSMRVPGDLVMQARLTDLSELDHQYARLLLSGASDLTLNKQNAEIMAAEQRLAYTVDSIARNVADWDTNLSDPYQSLLQSYRTLVNDRIALTKMRSTLQPDTASTDSNEAIPVDNIAEAELKAKDRIIQDLEATIRNMEKASVSYIASPVAHQPDDNTAQLKQQIREQQSSLEKSKLLNTALREENEQLSRNAKAFDNTATEERFETMNADVTFAAIDCNLTRVDANQIISNARQRKQLLMESLRMLNTLSRSSSAAVRKKAKEKTELLNRISSTLRD